MRSPRWRSRAMTAAALASLFMLGTAGAAQAAPRLTITTLVNLDGDVRSALDVRWLDDSHVAFAAGKDGVFRFDFRSTVSEQLIPGASKRGGFFFSSRLGRSQRFTVTAAHFASLVWRRNEPSSPVSEPVDFDAITDIDVYGDRVVVLGARRDVRGRFASEGAIAWTGTLTSSLKDLRPLHYSETGPGARALNRCPFLNGAVRFRRDGSVLVVPAYETGMFLYDSGGKLSKSWPTAGLGFQDRCTLTDAEFETLAADPTARWEWFNERAILDDVVPLGDATGLIVRQLVNRKRQWTFTIVEDGKVTARLPIPISASERSQIRADISGRRLALLVIDFATSASPARARLAIADLAE